MMYGICRDAKVYTVVINSEILLPMNRDQNDMEDSDDYAEEQRQQFAQGSME